MQCPCNTCDLHTCTSSLLSQTSSHPPEKSSSEEWEMINQLLTLETCCCWLTPFYHLVLSRESWRTPWPKSAWSLTPVATTRFRKRTEFLGKRRYVHDVYTVTTEGQHAVLMYELAGTLFWACFVIFYFQTAVDTLLMKLTTTIHDSAYAVVAEYVKVSYRSNGC